MARTRRTCSNCGKQTYTTGDFCPYCATSLIPPIIDPNTAPAVVSSNPNQADFEPIIKPATADDENNGGRKMKNIIDTILKILLGILLIILIIIAGSYFFTSCRSNNSLVSETTPAAETTTNTTDITDATAATTIAADARSFSLGVPADVNTVDPSVWNEPLQDAVMVDGNGTTVYTQSGKDGSVLLKGQIPDGQALILDSYALSKVVNDKTESYSGGCILVLVGPFDLDSNPISYTDGAAQMIGVTSLQSFLDSNVAVKFARGDWSIEKNQWSYEPWALIHVWTPTGYEFNQLVLTYENDIYPNKTTATDMTVNK